MKAGRYLRLHGAVTESGCPVQAPPISSTTAPGLSLFVDFFAGKCFSTAATTPLRRTSSISSTDPPYRCPVHAPAASASLHPPGEAYSRLLKDWGRSAGCRIIVCSIKLDATGGALKTLTAHDRPRSFWHRLRPASDRQAI